MAFSTGSNFSTVSFFPAALNTKGQPEICPQGDRRGDEVVDYVARITQDQKLGAQFVREGDEIVIRT